MKISVIERIHSFLPYSVNKKLIEKRLGSIHVNNSLMTYNIAISSPYIDLKDIVENELDKCVAFLPYCSKPLGNLACPLSINSSSRKNGICLKLEDKRCNVPCSLGEMIDVLKKYGFTKDRIFIIDSDSNLFPWLEKKKAEGYKYFLPGIGCHYGVAYALKYVQSEIGLEGCIIFLQDQDPFDKEHGVCKSFFDYNNMEKADKGKRTMISNESIKIIENILSGKNQF
jgi:hypothetical protein